MDRFISEEQLKQINFQALCPYSLLLEIAWVCVNWFQLIPFYNLTGISSTHFFYWILCYFSNNVTMKELRILQWGNPDFHKSERTNLHWVSFFIPRTYSRPIKQNPQGWKAYTDTLVLKCPLDYCNVLKE